ncbi:MAG: hypothetical protein Q4F34_07705 [Prevotellaceae bacterium]|nr:hypothetical protein [Prevotellaceae bacterium]
MKKITIVALLLTVSMLTSAQNLHYMSINGAYYENGMLFDYVNGNKYVDLGDAIIWSALDLGSNSVLEKGGKYTMAEIAKEIKSHWDDSWRLPTLEEWKAIKNLAFVENYKNTGVPGYTITGNGQTMFIPLEDPALYETNNNVSYKTSDPELCINWNRNSMFYEGASYENYKVRTRLVKQSSAHEGMTLTVYADGCDEPNRMLGLKTGDKVVVTAIPGTIGLPFRGWQDGNTDNPRTVVIATEDLTLTAFFYNDLQKFKDEAIQRIIATKKNYDTKYINNIVQTYVTQIENVTHYNDIEPIEHDAQTAINAAISQANTVLGKLGQAQNECPAVVITKDGETITICNPDQVKFIKRQ